MKVPDYVQAIVGWRVWSQFPHGLLGSPYGDVLWPPRRPLWAECRFSSARGVQVVAPDPECSCGIYALMQPPDSIRDVPWARRVTGEVYLWGKVIHHEFGYRAEFAYP
jgi:hypothetical protein